METKDAGIGAAVAVLLAILGLIITVGIILLMMWEQPGIPHSPSQQGSLRLPGVFRNLRPMEVAASAARLTVSGSRALRSCRIPSRRSTGSRR